MRLWERICGDSQDLQDFKRILRIHKTLGGDLQGFVRIHENSQDWERICKTLEQNSWGFPRIRETGRGFTRICKNS